MRTYRGSSSVLAVISSRSSSSHSCCAFTKSIPCFSRLALLFEVSNSKFILVWKLYRHGSFCQSRKDSIAQTRLSATATRPLGAPRARLAWRLHSFATNPHESCAPAKPQWVPVPLVKSRGNMPALGVDVGGQRKRIKARKDSRYIFLSSCPRVESRVRAHSRRIPLGRCGWSPQSDWQVARVR